MSEQQDTVQALQKDAQEEAKKDQDVEQEIIPEVNQDIKESLLDMGFPVNKCIRAAWFTGNSGLENALQWIEEHEEDEEANLELKVSKAEIEQSKKPKLTVEEARQQMEQLRKKINERREEKEKELEVERERNRVRMGKEMAAARRLEETEELKRNVDFRQRQKMDDQRAMDALRKKLEEDKKARRRALGKPEELTEDEKIEEEKKRKEQQDKLQKSPLLNVKPVIQKEKTRNLLLDMKKQNQGKDQVFQTACQTLLKYLGNVVSNPQEEKYRKIRISNSAFQQRVLGAGQQPLTILNIAGFKKGETDDYIYMPLDQIQQSLLEGIGEEINGALNNPFFGSL